MTKHRASRGGERRRAPNQHRAEVRPRYGRIAAFGSSVLLTFVSVLGSAGALPSSADDPSAAGDTAVEVAADSSPAPTADLSEGPTLVPEPEAADDRDAGGREPVEHDAAADFALPEESGKGRRVVFSESQQRVWLVSDDGTVRNTYPASGSLLDNLDPGTYEVFSRSRHAVGIDDSGTMQYFVRFTRGPTGAAIGFHDIPVDDGVPLQTVDELGTPQSHGCIRQKRSDAIELWNFAPIGTTVVVTA